MTRSVGLILLGIGGALFLLIAFVVSGNGLAEPQRVAADPKVGTANAGHGFGYRHDAKPSAAARWPERFTEWLGDSGLLK